MKSFLGSCKLLTFYIKSILPMYVFFWNPAKHILIFDILPSPQFHTSRLKRIITIPFIKVLFCIFSSILDFSHLVLTIRYYIYSAQILNFCHERKFKIVNPPWYTTLLAWSPKKSSISYIHVAIYYDDCDYLHTIFTMYLLYTTQNFVFWVNISSKNSFFFFENDHMNDYWPTILLIPLRDLAVCFISSCFSCSYLNTKYIYSITYRY